MKEIVLLKVIFLVCLVFLLTKCNYDNLGISKTPVSVKEAFKPFEELAVVKPESYEDLIKKVFDKMSSGEKIQDLDCSVKMDIDSEDSKSLSDFIVYKIKDTIKTIKTPSKAAPMIGEEFSIIDLSGYLAKNAAVITFTLFHTKRYFAIQCRAVATRGSDTDKKSEPWLIHKIKLAQEADEHDGPDGPDKKETFQVKGVDMNCQAVGSVLQELQIPSLESVTYPKSLESLIKKLQELVPEIKNKQIKMNVNTRIFGQNTQAIAPQNTNKACCYTHGKITGSQISDQTVASIKEPETKPSDSLRKLFSA